MEQEDTYKHFGVFQGREVIVMGHDQTTGLCMVCDPGYLPAAESRELKAIATSRSSQRLNYLIPALMREYFVAAKTDWYTHLVRKLGKGCVFNAPLKDITEMNKEQKGIFKGYKRPTNEDIDEQTQTGLRKNKPDTDAPKFAGRKYTGETAEDLVEDINSPKGYSDYPDDSDEPITRARIPLGVAEPKDAGTMKAINDLGNKFDNLAALLVDVIKAQNKPLVESAPVKPKRTRRPNQPKVAE